MLFMTLVNLIVTVTSMGHHPLPAGLTVVVIAIAPVHRLLVVDRRPSFSVFDSAAWVLVWSSALDLHIVHALRTLLLARQADRSLTSAFNFPVSADNTLQAVSTKWMMRLRKSRTHHFVQATNVPASPMGLSSSSSGDPPSVPSPNDFLFFGAFFLADPAPGCGEFEPELVWPV